jgi:hypothetical protein
VSRAGPLIAVEEAARGRARLDHAVKNLSTLQEPGGRRLACLCKPGKEVLQSEAAA